MTDCNIVLKTSEASPDLKDWTHFGKSCVIPFKMNSKASVSTPLTNPKVKRRLIQPSFINYQVLKKVQSYDELEAFINSMKTQKILDKITVDTNYTPHKNSFRLKLKLAEQTRRLRVINDCIDNKYVITYFRISVDGYTNYWSKDTALSTVFCYCYTITT